MFTFLVVTTWLPCCRLAVFRYSAPAETVFNVQSGADPSKDFTLQMTKLAHGLLSGDYSRAPEQDDTAAAADPTQPRTVVSITRPSIDW